MYFSSILLKRVKHSKTKSNVNEMVSGLTNPMVETDLVKARLG